LAKTALESFRKRLAQLQAEQEKLGLNEGRRLWDPELSCPVVPAIRPEEGWPLASKPFLGRKP